MITLDWDNIGLSTCLNRLAQIVNWFANDKEIKLYYRQSANKKGYHVKIIGVENDFEFRESFWDDEKRIIIDKRRITQGLPINVLFDVKEYREDKNSDVTYKHVGKWVQIK